MQPWPGKWLMRSLAMVSSGEDVWKVQSASDGWAPCNCTLYLPVPLTKLMTIADDSVNPV